jgi:hypothetical protein
MTTAAVPATRPGPVAITDMTEEAQAALLQRFPPREPAVSWPATTLSREEIIGRIPQPRRGQDGSHKWSSRRQGAATILTWLENFPGSTWQERWQASPAPSSDPAEWMSTGTAWTDPHGRPVPNTKRRNPGSGKLMLFAYDIIRPELPWLVAMRPSLHLRNVVADHRDPEGFARLADLLGEDVWASTTAATAQSQIIRIRAGASATSRSATASNSG